MIFKNKGGTFWSSPFVCFFSKQ